ncbi:hypothetical protein DACRYDRAFT_103965 [Dacryopinax primogenitus]|uniref:Uncharacterized protein n=1 Tax=Dacryopinax primogenitus (strain DJM 731) TaxID=1858805 RepID=M5GEJ7_DACPD|nr:uncharacterized protein DACRYDRAFT_103965 [Dacryopinax primogenitus]EJU05477.1 hypothetical protein DACRYDRAFT_103965 [Dacryopinax primogenitus]
MLPFVYINGIADIIIAELLFSDTLPAADWEAEVKDEETSKDHWLFKTAAAIQHTLDEADAYGIVDLKDIMRVSEGSKDIRGSVTSTTLGNMK